MLVAVCVSLIVLSFFLFPLNFHAKGTIDVFTGGGEIAFHFFVIKIFDGLLELEREQDGKNVIFIKNENNYKVLAELHLTADKTDDKSIINFFKAPIASSINITDFDIDVKVGNSGDALFTALTLATMRSAYASGMSVVKCWQTIRTNESFVAVYDKNIFKIDFLGIVTFNLADIIYGVVLAIRRKAKLARKHKLAKISN